MIHRQLTDEYIIPGFGTPADQSTLENEVYPSDDGFAVTRSDLSEESTEEPSQHFLDRVSRHLGKRTTRAIRNAEVNRRGLLGVGLLAVLVGLTDKVASD